MKVDSIRLFSSVKPTFMRRALIKGSLIAGSGVLLLAYCGAFIPPESLQIWGLPVLFAGGTLITMGLLPYRRLRRMESQPSELIVVDGKYIQYINDGKQVYSIPMQSIERYDYVETDTEYGIAVLLKDSPQEKIVVHDRKFDMESHQKKSKEKYGCHIFIPYFSRRAFTRIALLD
ncbi:MAG: hypothetical protein VX777_01565 [Chlamydiota bacterium]|nr:hypothetical protein [Chlamydiota bacterium]